MILVIGESGTGKSTSLENLNPEETFIIQSISKPLPFRGWRRKYKTFNSKDDSGNLIVTDISETIVSSLKYISSNRPEIKTVIIDDFQYVMANEFMRRVKETGFDKFSDMGKNAWSVVKEMNNLRADLVPILMSHSESSESGKTKLKTLGKVLDDKVVLEGMFTVVMQSVKYDDKYVFVTQNNGSNTCKSPKGMFDDVLIPNDMTEIVKAYNKYNDADLEELKHDLISEIDSAKTPEELKSIYARYPEFRGDEMVIAMIASRNESLSKPKRLPDGVDPDTWDNDLYTECSRVINETHGKATDGRLNRHQMVVATLDMYKKKLEEKLNEEAR